MLGQDEIRRRMVAARELRDMDQKTMDALGSEHGLGKQELGRVERGEIGEFRAKHRTALSTILRVPETWFTEESVDAIVGYLDPDRIRTLGEVERLLRGLTETARALQEEVAPPPREDGDTDPPSPAAEAGSE